MISLAEKIDKSLHARVLVWASFGLVIAALFINVAVPIFLKPVDPVKFLSVTVSTTKVSPRDSVFVKVKREKVRDCPVYVTVFWQDKSGFVTNTRTRPGQMSRLNIDTFSFNVIIPRNLTAGVWSYNATLTYTCNDEIIPVRFDPIWFEVST